MTHEFDSLDGSFPPRVHAALGAIALRLGAAGVPWLLAGSAGRRLAGARRRPRDLDVEVAVTDAARAADALGLVLADDRDGGWSSQRATGELAGVGIDLSAGIAVSGAGVRLDPDDALVAQWARRVELGGLEIWLAPPEEALVRAIVAGDWARLAKLAEAGGPPPRIGYVVRRLAAARAVR